MKKILIIVCVAIIHFFWSFYSVTMTESFWFYLVEIERILSLQHFSKVKNLPLRFCLLNYSVIRVILDLQPREKAAILVNSSTSSWQ